MPTTGEPASRRRRARPRSREEVSASRSDGCGCFPTRPPLPGHRAPPQGDDPRPRRRASRKTSRGSEIDIALLDVETTGRDAAVDRVIEVGIVVGRARRSRCKIQLAHQPRHAHPGRGHRHPRHHRRDGRGQAALRGGRARDRRRAPGCVPAAYNALVRPAFLMSEFSRARPSRSTGVARAHAATSSGSTRSSGRAKSRTTSARARSATSPRASACSSRRPTARATTPRPRCASSTRSARTPRIPTAVRRDRPGAAAPLAEAGRRRDAAQLERASDRERVDDQLPHGRPRSESPHVAPGSQDPPSAVHRG